MEDWVVIVLLTLFAVLSSVVPATFCEDNNKRDKERSRERKIHTEREKRETESFTVVKAVGF